MAMLVCANAILSDQKRYKGGKVPPLVKNNTGKAILNSISSQEAVEMGKQMLPQFTHKELAAQGAMFVPLQCIDLTDTTGLSTKKEKDAVSRPAFAFEQQCQLIAKRAGLTRTQFLNRTPGAGPWHIGPGVYMIGFMFMPIEFGKRIGRDIVSVRGYFE